MHLTLQPEEPSAAPWTPVPVADLAARLIDLSGGPGRPLLVAVDGRSASGKSTLSAALATALGGAPVIHTDDLCWHEPMFAWEHLLREVLTLLRRDGALDFVPPAWRTRGRSGSITVPPARPVVLVEGVGSSHREVADLLDVRIWVQSDDSLAERRGIARDVAEGTNGDAAEAERFWFEWIAAERRFLASDRPWERADLVVCGTPAEPPPPGTVAVAPGPLGEVSPGSAWWHGPARPAH